MKAVVIRFCFVIFLSAFAASCTTPTEYQPNGLRGGYSERQLQDDVWEVRAEGNVYTSPARIWDILVLRASELTIENGYQNFAVVGGTGLGETRLSVYAPASSTTTATGNTLLRGNTARTTITAHTTYSPPSSWTSAPFPEGNIIVKMFKSNDKKPKGAVNARTEISRLKPRFSKK